MRADPRSRYLRIITTPEPEPPPPEPRVKPVDVLWTLLGAAGLIAWGATAVFVVS